MSTNSTIAMKQKDGTIKGIYCHWDGYKEGGVGQMLLEHYTDPEKINKLINMGAASCLHTEISFNDEKQVNDFNNADENVSVFYHRDRGEDLMIHEAISEKSFLTNYGQQFNYLYKNDKWYVTGTGNKYTTPLKI